MRLLYLFLSVMILSACDTTMDMPPASTAITQDAVPTINPENAYLRTAQVNYQRYCAHCHGYGGEGQHPDTIERTTNLGYHLVPAHDATGHTWQHPDQLLFETIKYGVQAPTNFYIMIAFNETLSDEEIYGIIDYMRLWWTDEQQAWQAQLTSQFEENNPRWTTNRLDEQP